ncbi:MAG TPA: ATP:cob(I)alamin adenosyltransferase [Candidatus Woesebacteria bacterium]|nr:ATP:cob(I)alamin adenosyltransferase [Candidatus Woesebacteria bacterium]
MSEESDRGRTQGECLLDVSKNSPFVEAVGSIDRFQASLGLAKVKMTNTDEKKRFSQMEKDLYEIMGSLYMGQSWANGDKKIEQIDKEIESTKKRISNLEGFLIPGENEIEARINLCRTDCREAERRLVSLKIDREEKENLKFDLNVLKYFNRLSSLLNLMWRSKF